MQEKTYNLTYKQILDFQTKLTPIYNRVKCPMPAKESIIKTFEACQAKTKQATDAVAAITLPGEAATEAEIAEYTADVASIWGTKTNITALMMVKKECPTHWSPRETHSIYFMFTDWADNG